MIWPSTTTAAASSTTAAAPTRMTLVAPPQTNILLARLAAAAVAAALLATAIFATGCKGNGGGASAGGVAAAQGSSADPTAFGKLIKSGPAPLNYRIGSAGTLRILDTTDNNALVVSTPVPTAAGVNINDAKGVTVNGTVVKAGPLAPHHRYALWLDPNPKQ